MVASAPVYSTVAMAAHQLYPAPAGFCLFRVGYSQSNHKYYGKMDWKP